MPNFSASLRDGTGAVALYVVGSTIQINDYSNYIASTENGHLLADFEFKKIIVKQLNTSTVYTFFTSAGFDEIIVPPYTFTTTPYPPIVDYYTFTGDGIYSITLRTVPTFIKQTPYSIGDCLVYLGVLYQSLINNNAAIPPHTGSWTVIAEDDLPTKYNVTEYIAIDCSVLLCLADLVYQANCIELNVDCNDSELCSNKTWRNAMRLQMIVDDIPYLMDNGDYDKIQVLLNEASTICSCCGWVNPTSIK
jgi:hypothetical protein